MPNEPATTEGHERTPSPTDDLPHVVILGAGFGGLACAQALGGHQVRVTVIDKQNYHLFVPLLYQVATAALSPADIAEPIRKALRRHNNIDVVLGEVTSVDPEQKRVILQGGGYVSYDQLVVATGSLYNYFGHDEWARIAPGLKTIANARAIRAKVLLGFELAEFSRDPEEQRRLTTTVVVGGGPTGVEIAGAVAELARWSLARDFRNIDPRTATVLLIEAGPRILAPFPEPLARPRTQRALAVTGVVGAAMAFFTDYEGGAVRKIPMTLHLNLDTLNGIILLDQARRARGEPFAGRAAMAVMGASKMAADPLWRCLLARAFVTGTTAKCVRS